MTSRFPQGLAGMALRRAAHWVLAGLAAWLAGQLRGCDFDDDVEAGAIWGFPEIGVPPNHPL